MEKIKIILTIDQLRILVKLFYCSGEMPIQNKSKKATFNIAQIMDKRLRKLVITKEHTTKEFTIKFHYFEAYFLEIIINNRIELFKNSMYQFNFLHSLLAKLDQQLV